MVKELTPRHEQLFPVPSFHGITLPVEIIDLPSILLPLERTPFCAIGRMVLPILTFLASGLGELGLLLLEVLLSFTLLIL